MHSNSFARQKIFSFNEIQFSIKTMLLAISCVAVLMMLFQHEAGSRNNYGVFSPHFSALMAMICFWKYLIIRMRAPQNVRRAAFVLLLVSAMPFVYWQCWLVPQFIAPRGVHLAVDPIWVFTIPTVSFIWFDQKKKFVVLDEYCFRSLLEMFVVVPIWSVVLTLICLAVGLFDSVAFFTAGAWTC